MSRFITASYVSRLVPISLSRSRVVLFIRMFPLSINCILLFIRYIVYVVDKNAIHLNVETGELSC